MPALSQRSYQPELLDRDDIPFEDIRQNMLELDTINRLLGGHAITLKGLSQLTPKHTGEVHVVEIGCGGGDNLRAILRHCKKKDIKVRLTGIDINKECIEFARSRKENAGIEFILSDYSKVVFEERPTIIFSSLFCHHFNEEQLGAMLHWMKQNSRTGFFINDLHRHILAYHSIRLLTRLFSKSYLVKNDAPLSVQRGFRKNDWIQLIERADLTGATSIEWCWAFRWLLVHKNQ